MTDGLEICGKSGSVWAFALHALSSELGQRVKLEDVAIGLPVDHHGLDETHIPRALSRLGLEGGVQLFDKLEHLPLPNCVFTGPDTFLVLTERKDGAYLVKDLRTENRASYMDAEDILAESDGRALIAGQSLDSLARKYSVGTNRGHWFWSRFLQYRGFLSHIVVGTLVANLLAVCISLFVLQVYDRVIPNESEPTLWALWIGVVIALIFEATLRVARATLIDVTGRDLELNVSSWLFDRLQGMKASRVQASGATLLNAVKEFSSVREFFTTTTISSIADIPFVLIFLLLIYAIAGPVVLIVLAAMLLIVVPSLLAQSKMVALAEEMMGGNTVANKLLIETIYSRDIVKSQRAEPFFQRQWEEILQVNAAKTTDQRLLSAKLQHWSSGVQQFAYVTAVLVGCYLVFDGQLTVGAIIAISILTSRAIAPVTQLSAALVRWHQVRAGLNALDVVALSDQDHDPTESKVSVSTLDGNYQFENVEYRFDEGTNPVLVLPNLKIQPGKVTAILGENGSGKSTLLRLMSGIAEPSAGIALLDGFQMNSIATNDLRRHIGWLPQETRLFSGTLRDNLELGRQTRSEESLFEALEFAGLAAHVNSHPAGLDMEIKDGGTGVSTGQKQSMALARLYLQDPSIVLLDEPTASLDQALERRVIQIFADWFKGKSVILTTHRPALLSLVDDIVVLSKGRVVLQGDKDTVLKQLTRNGD